jgi:hypothetical protein
MKEPEDAALSRAFELTFFFSPLSNHLKVRPREWLAMNGFRVTGVFTDKGYMQVMLIIRHRESW